MMPTLKKYFIEQRWALIAVFLGILVGFGSAIICIAWNLVIFGFNIMYIVSPLLAGFVETIIAVKKFGRSTGAISALLTFILINTYGWFGPGWIFPKEPATLSLITIMAIVLTLQAAFPTAINYILIVVGMGTLSKFIDFLIGVPSIISRKTIPIKETAKFSQADEVQFNELKMPIILSRRGSGMKIDKYLGLVVGEAVAEEKKSEGRVSNILKLITPVELDDIDLTTARKKALSNMLDEAESLGADMVEEVSVDYLTMGGLQGNVTLITALGTALKVQNKIFDSKIAEEDFKLEETNILQREEKISTEGDNISDKINTKEVVVDEELSSRIDQYIREKNNPPVKNLELATQAKFKEFENRYAKISNDLEKMDQQFDKCGEYAQKRINQMYDRTNLAHDYGLEKRGVRIKEGIIGREVVDVNAMVIGKVKDVDVNPKTKSLEALIIGKGGILGSIGSTANEIKIPYNMVLSFGDRILIKR
ncbi:heavy metal-binding domain-containing protein [Methanobacterium alcaliphilum]|uniref:heavy metal-binding domain-containing protein n=1 Tax=Methanobacterium alcaliphilum TaxID=392018 RepID=UPI00200BA013|nr:heavy metal-binding domain-containing protein [Methanobacterium alcaliphilum]MCK9151046.1 heavy metal-binding domain-containing protein [Methanobacterium alcaliphilum]